MASFTHTRTSRKKHLDAFVRFFSYIGIVTIGTFGLLNVVAGDSILGYIELGAVVAIFITIGLLRTNKNTLAPHLLITVLFVLLLSIAVRGGLANVGYIFLFVFPAVVFHLTTVRRGMIWSGTLILALTSLLILRNFSFIPLPYSTEVIVQIIVAFTILVVITRTSAIFLEEDMRLITEQEKYLHATERRIGESNNILTQQKKELERTVATTEKTKKAFINVAEDLEIERNKLAIAKAKDEALLEYIGDGLVFVDTKGVIQVINNAAEKMLGVRDVEVLDKKWFEVVNVVNEKGEHFQTRDLPIARVLSSDIRVVTTTLKDGYYYTRSDGKIFPVVITASQVVLKTKLLGGIIVFRDVTHEQNVDKAKSEFVSVASHQLRTPMTGIKWVVERFAKKETLSKKGQEYVKDIQASVDRLIELVDALLNVSRIESGGGLSVVPEDMDAVTFIVQYLRETAPLQKKKNITVVFTEHPDTVPLVIDTKIFENIFHSLVSNALEYTPEGGTITISIAIIETGTILLKVKDTGIGIPEKDQVSIFEKFHRADNAMLVKTDGTGLGLYIAKQATELLGGTIEFRSKENIGTTFYVTLPQKVTARDGNKTLL